MVASPSANLLPGKGQEPLPSRTCTTPFNVRGSEEAGATEIGAGIGLEVEADSTSAG